MVLVKKQVKTLVKTKQFSTKAIAKKAAVKKVIAKKTTTTSAKASPKKPQSAVKKTW